MQWAICLGLCAWLSAHGSLNVKNHREQQAGSYEWMATGDSMKQGAQEQQHMEKSKLACCEDYHTVTL